MNSLFRDTCRGGVTSNEVSCPSLIKLTGGKYGNNNREA